MPLISQYDVIFIHIPKTAGTSIEYALQFPQFYNDGEQLKKWYGVVNNYELDHSTINYLIKNCDFYNNSLFKFCVVRNPYERLVSEYHYCQEYGSRFIKSIENFKTFVYDLNKKFWFVLENEENDKYHLLISHYLPQYKFTHIKDECKMDMILRFENLEQDWKIFCKHMKKDIQLNKMKLYSSNKVYSYEDYYDDDLKKIVFEMYKDDFRIFNYPQ